jgi:hypothetical protein
MTAQPLFLDHELTFDGEEKLAGMLSRLGDNVDLWPQEIAQEAYKQLPYLSDFNPEVMLDKVDEERGFAFGAIVVRPHSAMSAQEQESTPLKKVNIPVVVKEQNLQPFDVFLHGDKYEHLTEGRLRAALFRAETFDAIRDRPVEPALINQLQPPSQGGYGGGGTKLGSAELARIPLLPQLHGRVSEKHVDRVKEAVAGDAALRSVITNGDEGVKAAFESAMNLEGSDHMKTASVMADNIRPTVVQLRKLNNGNSMLKWANEGMYAPQEQELNEADTFEMLGGSKDLVEQLERDGSVTLSPDPVVKKSDNLEELSVIDKFGLWKVQDLQGNTLIGWVFPKVLSLNNQPLPLSLFSNGSQHALQEKIAGGLAGKSTDIPKGVPRGYGCLYYIDHGSAKAFVPMNIKTTYRGPDGSLQYMAELDTGEDVMFHYADAMKTVAQVGDGQYIVPTSYEWMPLRGKTELVPEPNMMSKVANKSWVGTAELVGDAGVFSYRGPAIAKLAAEHTKFLDKDKAAFLGVALGLSHSFCKEALAKASRGELVELTGLRPITPAREKMAEARAKVRKELSELDPPVHNYFLAKEAAVLDDALTADKILGLGFLNAENIATFVDMLPTLEDTSSKLAEMLVAVRLGMKDVPEVAVERMLIALEDVIRGLKALRQKEQTYVN